MMLKRSLHCLENLFTCCVVSVDKTYLEDQGCCIWKQKEQRREKCAPVYILEVNKFLAGGTESVHSKAGLKVSCISWRFYLNLWRSYRWLNQWIIRTQ